MVDPRELQKVFEELDAQLERFANQKIGLMFFLIPSSMKLLKKIIADANQGGNISQKIITAIHTWITTMNKLDDECAYCISCEEQIGHHGVAAWAFLLPKANDSVGITAVVCGNCLKNCRDAEEFKASIRNAMAKHLGGELLSTH